jgi:hypothetical protein
MSSDRWTADDPQPGDFDAVLATIEAEYVERHTRLRILVSLEGKDARRLERIAEARGKTPHDAMAELLRDADRPAI